MADVSPFSLVRKTNAETMGIDSHQLQQLQRICELPVSIIASDDQASSIGWCSVTAATVAETDFAQ